MPSLIQSAFISGEWAPEYSARTDLDGYRHALAHAQNMLILPQGGATRRPGFMHVANAQLGSALHLPVRLLRFSPANDTVYTLEFGQGYVRFYRNKAQILSGGVPYGLVTPYQAGDLAGLGFVADQGTLYILHQLYPPQQLVNIADADWTFGPMSFEDGPYLDPGPTTTTMTPSAAGAATVTVTASSTAGINSGNGFQASDVGRLIRFQQPSWTLAGLNVATDAGSNYQPGEVVTPSGGTPVPNSDGTSETAQITVTAITSGGAIATGGVGISVPGQYILPPSSSFSQGASSGAGIGLAGLVTYLQNGAPLWIWGIITAVDSTTTISVALQPMIFDVLGTSSPGCFASTMALQNWCLGAWCPVAGYPQCGRIFQARLIVGGTTLQPKRLFAGQTAGPQQPQLSFSPSLASGQVVDSNGFVFDLYDEQEDPIGWMEEVGSAQIPQLGIGTGNAEFILQPGSTSTALAPTNVQVYRETKYTNAPVPPVRIGHLLLFLERGAKKLREWCYKYFAGGYIGAEASPYGKHLTIGGIKQFDYALVPNPTIWAVTNDDHLIALTYVPDVNYASIPAPNIAAWAPQPVGGSYYGGYALVESVAICPSEDGSYDQVWISVLRTDGGLATRTIEVQSAPFRSATLDQAVFVDGAISTPLTEPSATCTPNPAPASAFLALPQRGQSCTFAFDGAVAAAGDTAPGTILRINSGNFLVTAVESAELVTCTCLDPPTSLSPQPSGSWSYTKQAVSFGGFAEHNGRTLSVLADGAVQGPCLVANGTITLASPASYVTAGLAAPAILETLDLDLPAPDGTTQMKEGRLDHLYLRVFESAGGRYGPDADNLDEIPSRTTDDLLGWSAMISGDLRLAMPGGYSARRRVRVEHDDPLPLTVTALVVKGGTTEQAPR